jgi:hypothetical protein
VKSQDTIDTALSTLLNDAFITKADPSRFE